MDHLAWAHYYINDLDTAIKYLEYQVGYYLRRKNAPSSIQAEWEKAMMNVALFYSTGVTSKPNPLTTFKNALNLMLRLRPPRAILSKCLVHFTYLLSREGTRFRPRGTEDRRFQQPGQERRKPSTSPGRL